MPPCSDHQEWLLAQRLYQHDFSTFGFAAGDPPRERRRTRLRRRLGWPERGWATEALAQVDPAPISSHERELTAWSRQLAWHWGPVAQQPETVEPWPAVRTR